MKLSYDSKLKRHIIEVEIGVKNILYCKRCKKKIDDDDAYFCPEGKYLFCLDCKDTAFEICPKSFYFRSAGKAEHAHKFVLIKEVEIEVEVKIEEEK